MPNHDPQLIRWCNDELLLPVKISAASGAEASLSNFVALAHVVARVAAVAGVVLPPSFTSELQTDDTTVAKVYNASVLAPVLARLGITVKPALFDDVATEARGAGLHMLFLLKEKYDVATGAYVPEAQASPRSRARDGLTGEASSHAGTRRRIAEADDGKPFLTRLLEKGMTVKAAQQEVHLKRFEDHRAAMDASIAAAEAADRTGKLGATHKLALKQITLAQDRNAWLHNAEETEGALHSLELQRRYDRERIDLAYELTSMERARIEAKNALLMSRRGALGEGGISGQEARMKRMGIDPYTSNYEAAFGTGSNSIGRVEESSRRRVVGGVSSSSIQALAPKPIEQVATAVLAAALPGIDRTTLTHSIARLTSSDGVAPLHASLEASLQSLGSTSSSLQGGAGESPQEYQERVVASFAASFKPREVKLYTEELQKKVHNAAVHRRERDTRGRLMSASQAEQAAAVANAREEQADVQRFRDTARVERAAAEMYALAKAEKAERTAAGIAWAQRTFETSELRFAERAQRDRAEAEAERQAKQDLQRPVIEARAHARAEAATAARATLMTMVRGDVTELLVDLALAVSDGVDAAGATGRDTPGLFPEEWRALKQTFVDGSIREGRVAQQKEAARLAAMASGRPGGVPEVPGAPHGLQQWGVILGERVVGSDVKVGRSESGAGSVGAPARLGPAGPFTPSLDVDPTLLTAYLDGCDYTDWAEGRGAWAGTSKAAALSPTSHHSPTRSRRSSAILSSSPHGSEDAGGGGRAFAGAGDADTHHAELATASVTSDGTHSSTALPSPHRASSPPHVPATATAGPTWAVAVPSSPTALRGVAEGLVAMAGSMQAEAYLGPPLLLARPTTLLLAQADGDRAVTGEVRLRASVAQATVSTRLAGRLRLVHVSAQDVLLAAAAVFDTQNASLRTQAAATSLKPSSFPSVSSLGCGSLASALVSWSSDAHGTRLRPEAFQHTSGPEAEECTAVLYELGAQVALSQAALYKALRAGPGGASCVGGEGAPPPPATVTDEQLQRGVGDVKTADVDEGVQALLTSRSAVLAAVSAAAAAVADAGSAPPTKDTKDVKSRPGSGKDAGKKGAPAPAPAKGGKDVVKGKEGAPTLEPASSAASPLLGARLLTTPLFAKALAVYLTQAQRAVKDARVRYNAHSPVPVPTGYGGILLVGLPSCPAHVVAVEYALGGSLVWAQSARARSGAGEGAGSGTPAPSRPASALVVAPGASSSRPASALIPPGLSPSPHVPVGWDGALPTLLAALAAGTWQLPPVGPAAQLAWRAAVAADAERSAAEEATRAAAEAEAAAAAATAKPGDKKGARPSSTSTKVKPGASIPEGETKGPGPQPVATSAIEAVVTVSVDALSGALDEAALTGHTLAVDCFLGLPLLIPQTVLAMVIPPVPEPACAPPEPAGKAPGKGAKGDVAPTATTADEVPACVADVNATVQGLVLVCAGDSTRDAASSLPAAASECVSAWHALVPTLATLKVGRAGVGGGAGDDQLRRIAGALEVQLEHLLACSSHEHARPASAHGTDGAQALLLTAAARSVVIDTGTLLSCTRAYDACVAAHRDTVTHALHALRGVQSLSRAHTRRVARAFLRVLRGLPDPCLGEGHTPRFPVYSRSLAEVEHSLMSLRSKLLEAKTMQGKAGAKGKVAPTAGTSASAALTHPPAASRKEANGIILTDVGITNAQFLALAEQVCTMEVSAKGQDSGTVEELCRRASEAGTALWACVETAKETARALIHALKEDGWQQDTATTLHALAVLLIHCDLRASEDGIAFNCAARTVLTSDVSEGYAHLLEEWPVSVTPNAESGAERIPHLSISGGEAQALPVSLSARVGGGEVMTVVGSIPHHAEAVLTGSRCREYVPTAHWAAGSMQNLLSANEGDAVASAIVSVGWGRVLRTCTTLARLATHVHRSRDDMLEWCAAALATWTTARDTAINATVTGIQAVLRANRDPEAYRVAVADAERRSRLAAYAAHGTSGTRTPLSGTATPQSSVRPGIVPRGTGRAVATSLRRAGATGARSRHSAGEEEEQQGGGAGAADLGGTILAADVDMPRVTPLSFLVSTHDGVPEAYGWLSSADVSVRVVWGGQQVPEVNNVAGRMGGCVEGAPVPLAATLQAAKEVAECALRSLVQANMPRSTQASAVYAPGQAGRGALTRTGLGKTQQVAGALAAPSAHGLERPHAIVTALGLLEALAPSSTVTAQGILALTSALLECVSGEDEGGSSRERGGSGGRGRGRPPLLQTSFGGGGGAGAGWDTDVESMEEDEVGVVACARTIARALRNAAGGLAATKGTPSSSSIMSGGASRDLPPAWVHAPALVLMHLARAFGSKNTKKEGTSLVWDLDAVRRFAMALVFTRTVELPSVEQLVLQRRNLALADGDKDGLLSKAEFTGCCLWYETRPDVAHGAVAEGDRETAMVLTSRLAPGGPGLDLKHKIKVVHTVVGGRVAPEAAAAQGGEREVDVALSTTLVATSPAGRLTEADALREVVWRLFAQPVGEDVDIETASFGASTAISLGSAFGGRRPARGGGEEAPVRLDTAAYVRCLCSDPRTALVGCGVESVPAPHGSPLSLLSFLGSPLSAAAVSAGALQPAPNSTPGVAHLTGATRAAGMALANPRSEAYFARRQSHGSEEGSVGGGMGAGSGSAHPPTPRLPGLVKAWLVAADAEAADCATTAAPRLPSARERASGVALPTPDVLALELALRKLRACTSSALSSPLHVRLGMYWARDVLDGVGLEHISDTLAEDGEVSLEEALALLARLAPASGGPAPCAVPLSPGEALLPV